MKSTDPVTKVCKVCRRDLPLTAFHQNRTCRMGVRPECKDCIHKERTAYYERTKERAKAYSRQFYKDNAETVKAYQKDYSAEHRSSTRQYVRVAKHRGRAARTEASGTWTRQGLIEKFTYHGWRCYLCHEPGTLETLEIDHRKPLSRGGTNWIANLAPCCTKCNQAKGKKTETEYRAILS